MAELPLCAASEEAWLELYTGVCGYLHFPQGRSHSGETLFPDGVACNVKQGRGFLGEMLATACRSDRAGLMGNVETGHAVLAREKEKALPQVSAV